MNSKIKTILGIVLFAAFLGVAYFAYQDLSRQYKPQSEDNSSKDETTQNKVYKAPDFTVYDAEGNAVKPSDFTGKTIVLNFWASWCPPCKGEMPHFNEVYEDVKNDVVFMMVDMVDGERETQSKGQKYVEQQGYSFPVYYDNDQEAAYTYAVSSIPTTFLIDSQGNIAKAYQGAIDKETLAAAIESIKK